MSTATISSWGARLLVDEGWFRPNREWAFQVSHGYLHAPEQLEPENSAG